MSTNKRRTSVDLTPLAQKIKDEYVHHGLKNILSAGLVLFHIQNDTDKLMSIDVANDTAKKKVLSTGKAKLCKIKTFLKHELTNPQLCEGDKDFMQSILKMIDAPEDTNLIADFVAEVGQNNPKTKVESPGVIVKILSKDESADLRVIRDLLGPEKIEELRHAAEDDNAAAELAKDHRRKPNPHSRTESA